MAVVCSIINKKIDKIDAEVFYLLESYIIKNGIGSDKEDFSVIKSRLVSPPILSSTEFFEEVVYVILASGFRQKTAKEYFYKIINFIYSSPDISFDELILIFKNPNKIRAIIDVWENRVQYKDAFYSCTSVESKLDFVSTLPHIGEITKNHLIRNLGYNYVKYDVWIQRLGVALSGCATLCVGSKLSLDVKKICDEMFDNISLETNLPNGYIDVVLWKSCQVGLLIFK